MFFCIVAKTEKGKRRMEVWRRGEKKKKKGKFKPSRGVQDGRNCLLGKNVKEKQEKMILVMKKSEE